MCNNLITTTIAIATVIMAFLNFSCGGKNPADNKGQVLTKEKDVYYSIVNIKWGAKDFYSGEIPDSLKYPLCDYNLYFAFNSDSTVDFLDSYPFDETGNYSIEGQLITCLFTFSFYNEDTKSKFKEANDGKHNYKIIFLYKDNRLYCLDEQVRYKKIGWRKEAPLLLEKNQYLRNAGAYTNNKYNVYNRADLKPREPYDTTADALCVVERFDWRTETTFKNGKRNGLFKKYINSRLKLFGFFKDGQPCGDWYEFSSEGYTQCHWKEEKECNCDDFYNDEDEFVDLD